MARRAPGVARRSATATRRLRESGDAAGIATVVRARVLTCQKSISSSEESPFSAGFAVPLGKGEGEKEKTAEGSRRSTFARQHRRFLLAYALPGDLATFSRGSHVVA